MPDPENEPDFYAIDRLFPVAGNAKFVVPNPFLGCGMQPQMNPLLGGLGNFQQLPAGLLCMVNPTTMNPKQQQPPAKNEPTVGLQGMTGIKNAAASLNPGVQVVNAAKTQLQNVGDAKVFAALLQQQHLMFPQQKFQELSSQRAQSSSMRFM